MSITKKELVDWVSSFRNGKQNGDLIKNQVEPLIDSTFEAEVVCSVEGFDKLEQGWRLLTDQSEADTHLFQSFDWQRLWWKHFGGEHDLQILTVRKEGVLVGIAPLFVEKNSLFGLYDYTTLRFIGSMIPDDEAVGVFTGYSISDYLDIIIHPAYQRVVIETFIKYLKIGRRLFDDIELNELPGSGTVMNEVLPIIKERGWPIDQKERDVCVQLQLADSMDDCLDQMHSKARYELRYGMRAVRDKELFNVYRVKNRTELAAAFENLVELHQERWNSQGYPGVFINHDYEHFLGEVAEAFVEKDKLKMSIAYDDDNRCLAVDLAFLHSDRIYNYQKAFDAKAPLSKYSPGKALTYFLIEEGIEEHHGMVDLLRGAEKYKLRMTTHTTQNWKLRISGFDKKETMKRLTHRAARWVSGVSERLSQEQLLLKIHFRKWGKKGLLHYCTSLKDRVIKKL